MEHLDPLSTEKTLKDSSDILNHPKYTFKFQFSEPNRDGMNV